MFTQMPRATSNASFRLSQTLLFATSIVFALCLGVSPAFADETFSAKAQDAQYTGQPIYAKLVVKDRGKELVRGVDYVTSYRSNVNVGKATVKITGRGTYAGKTASTTFSIKKAPMSKAKSSQVKKAYAWTGKAIKPIPTLSFGKKSLVEGRDYSIKYRNNIKAGTATIVITGKRNLSGTKKITFKVSGVSLAKVQFREIKPRYTTSLTKVTPEPVVKYRGKKLKKNVDYTLTYRNNIQPGIATVVITGKGNFWGHKTMRFKLVNMGDDMARAACSISYSRGVYRSSGYPGTKRFMKAYKSVGSPLSFTQGRSCDAGMCTAIRYSGYDRKFPTALFPGGSSDIHKGIIAYLGYATNGNGTSPRWKYIGKYENVKDKLRPGDVLVGQQSSGARHICMYVGKNIAQDVYANTLKGTDSDVGKTTGYFVSSHYSHPASLGIGGPDWALTSKSYYKGKFKVFRCIKPQDTRYRAGKEVR